MGDVETQLRELFAADAAGAPEPFAGLAGAVRGRVRQARRRLAAVVASAVGVVAVAALVVPPLVGGAPATVRKLAGPASLPAGPGPSSSSGADEEESAVRYRGVVVPVPAAWLDPRRLSCSGVPIADAAYIDEPGQMIKACGMIQAPTDLTTVVLMPSDALPGTDPAYIGREKVLSDGRTQLTTVVRGAHVRVVVRSPDPRLARKILDGLRIDHDLAGCALRSPGPGPGPLVHNGWLQKATATGASVCGYTNGWLRTWRRLDPSEVPGLVGLLHEQHIAVLDMAPGCGGSSPVVKPLWVLLLQGTGEVPDGKDVVVAISGGDCTFASVYVNGTIGAPLTQSLYERLSQWDPGVGPMVVWTPPVPSSTS